MAAEMQTCVQYGMMIQPVLICQSVCLKGTCISSPKPFNTICMALRRAKEEAERKERQERQMKAEATRAKKKADEPRKKARLQFLPL